MFKKLRIKLFGRSKKEIYRDIHFLCLEISDTLEDISEDLDNIHESVQESLRLTLDIQDQCQEIIRIYESMQKRDKKDTSDIVGTKIDTAKDIADTQSFGELKGGQGRNNVPTLGRTTDIVAENIKDGFDNGEADGQ